MDEATENGPPVNVGDRVETTGIALVHEGEYVLPTSGSAARISSELSGGHDLEPALSKGPDEVHYWFPVEIEVVGNLDPGVADAIVARVYEELERELSSRS
ncbi:hypothetical protein [Arthrobacter sp. H41]|uniref:hypothetical protein n=1 Tax=Arthrobacter sp. H41 TaxID=1312978 RepID=UPI00047CBB40|nr:hypothetical protein [Arthrobacter sp. H41]